MRPEAEISEDTLNQVFAEIATSTKSLKTIHKNLKFKFCFQTLWKKLNSSDSILAQYARAKEQQADLLAEEMLEISDDEPDSNRARVKIDTRKWIASKLKPKRYADKLDMTHSISDTISKITIERVKEGENVQSEQR